MHLVVWGRRQLLTKMQPDVKNAIASASSDATRNAGYFQEQQSFMVGVPFSMGSGRIARPDGRRSARRGPYAKLTGPVRFHARRGRAVPRSSVESVAQELDDLVQLDPVPLLHR